jgi:hypothetical protein
MSKRTVRVYGFLEDAQGRVLVSAERFRGIPLVKYPGGGVEWGEGIHEALVRDLEGQTRRICAALGLEWSPARLRPEQSARRVTTASYAQVRQPVSDRGLLRSRAYRAHLQPLLDALGDLCPADLR